MWARTASWLARPATLGGFAITASQVWFVALARTPGFNLWSDFVSGLTTSTLFAGTIAAGVAAFESNRWAYSNAHRLMASSRSPLEARARHSLEVTASLLGGYLLTLVLCGIYASATRTYGLPYPWWLVAIGCALVLSGAFGYAVGGALAARVGRLWFAAPGAALVFLGAYIIVRVAKPPFGVVSLYPVLDALDDDFVDYVTSTMAGQAAYFLAVAGLLVMVGGSLRRLRRFVIIALTGVLVIAGVGGAAVVVRNNGQYTTGHNSRNFACASRHGVTLCLNRGYTSAMKPLLAQFDRMNERVAGTPLVTTRLEQNVMGYGDALAKGARSVYLEQYADADDIAATVSSYLETYGGLYKCEDPDAPGSIDQKLDAEFAELIVDGWLSGYYRRLYFGSATPEARLLQKFKTMSVPAGNAWLRAHFAKYESCRLTYADLP